MYTNDHITLMVCMDEKPYQLLGETRKPLPVRCGDTKKIDYEYVRKGTSYSNRLGGGYKDEMYPDIDKIVLVMDNLNTHKTSSLYKKYPADEARRIIRKLEIHYTPKHGSRLDIAEIELNVMTRRCLNIDTLRAELYAWEQEQNKNASKVNWQFNTLDARVKLQSLYPNLETIIDD